MSCAEFFGACSLSASMISLTCAVLSVTACSSLARFHDFHARLLVARSSSRFCPYRCDSRTLCWIEGRALLCNADQRP